MRIAQFAQKPLRIESGRFLVCFFEKLVLKFEAMKIETVSFEKEQGKAAESRKLHFEEIEELREPIRGLLLKLRDKIDAGKYSLIVGDDASGRIPTIIFNKIIGGLCKARGIKLPQALFFAGSRSFSPEELERKTFAVSNNLQENIRKGRIDKDLEALVVTDTIATGSSLKHICEALKENGIRFDIVTIGLFSPAEDVEKFLGGKVLSATSEPPKVYTSYRKGFSGVKKSSGSTFSESRKKLERKLWESWGTSEEDVQMVVQDQAEEERIAREDADILAKDLIQWYEESEEKRGNN